MRPAALKLVFLLSQFLLFRVCLSQVFPVQLSTQLIPPYSSYLPDYGDPTNEKLKCILVLQDFSVTHRDVRLEISITGNGFSIHTNPTFIPSAITLTPGNPVLITGTDLAPYLETSHLIFTGINAADYELEKILPEGHYSICIRAYDYYNPSPTQISNESCNYAWFFLNDPPYLNFPACETEITPVTPQNIIFQWTAMNLNSPNSSFNTEYDFELFELRPNNGIPNNVVQNSAPVFSTTTTNPFFQYGITEPTLYLGMNYVWRVRARDLSGRDLFKNDGWSQICTFTYGNINSAFPSGSFALTANSTASTHRQGKVWWNHIANFSQYHLQIRKVGTENWFDYYTTTPELKVNELEPSTAYEARVMGTGNNLESAWSNTTAFTTPPQPQFGCNDQTQPINALSANPLTLATPGMIFQIGQFEMTATQIIPDPGMPGYFSGYGKVMMYALNIGVQYNHVYINDNLQITSGNLIALTEGIDQWEADWMLHQAINDAVWIDGTIDDVYVSDSLIYVITDDGDTLTYEFPDEGPLVINDEEGNQYIVYPDGTIVEGSWLDYSNDHLDCTAENKVVFSKYEEQLYGFDQYEHPQWSDDVEVIRLSDSTNYFVANKSLKEGGDDYVWAAFANENLPLSTLTFKTSAGETLTHEISGNKIKLHLQNISDGESVYAMANEQRLGKLNVRVYAEEEKKLVLVPVGNAALPDETTLRNELNKIFGQGVMRFTVSSAAAFTNTAWDTNGDGLVAAGNHGALQDYSEEMKNLSSAWLYANETNKDAFVLFVIPGFDAENVDKGGYMPLGRHKGFIKTGSDLKVYLHEIGHGAFGLEHTFPEVAESSTNNLMDYSGGKELRTLQWKIMRQDWSHFSLLDDEDDGFYSLSFVNEEGNIVEEENLTPEVTNCGRYLTRFNKVLKFDAVTRSRINKVLVDGNRIKGVLMDVNGVERRFLQATEAKTYTEYNVLKVSANDYNHSFICFECLDTYCDVVSAFTGPDKCEIVMAKNENNQDTKIYNRIPSDFVLHLNSFLTDCGDGIYVFDHVENGNIICKPVNGLDCHETEEDSEGHEFTGEELVQINEVSEDFYGCSRDVSWLYPGGYPVKGSSLESIAAAHILLGFKVDGVEYVQCDYGSENTFNTTAFYAFVDKDAFLQKKAELADEGKLIRVKDLTPIMLYGKEKFTTSGYGDKIHYKRFDHRGCYFEYEFAHTGRTQYEYNGHLYEDVDNTVIWRTSCASEILVELFCDELNVQEGAAEASSYLSFLNNISNIPPSFYNPDHPDYSSLVKDVTYGSDPTNWQNPESAVDFAFVCGLYNGVVNILHDLDEILPIIAKYICDIQFRTQVNDAIRDLNLETIYAAIEGDFNGNKYENAEAAGRYTIEVVSLIIPIAKANWGTKLRTLVTKVSTLPKKTMTFIKSVRSNSVAGVEILEDNMTGLQKIIFVDGSNTDVELARFTEEGVMQVDEARLIAQTPENSVPLFDIGEVPYKAGNNAPTTGHLKLVKTPDGEVWVVKEITELGWIDELETVLPVGAKAKITGWIDEGLDPNKTREAFNLASDKTSLYNNLNSAKSIYHQRVYIKDWENIPGVSVKSYEPNGLTSAHSNSAWANDDLDLPLREARNFSNVVADELPAGTIIYRVTGENKAGGYWVIHKPNTLAEVIGGTAVRPEWNNFGKMYKYVVPEGEVLKVWKGPASRQQIGDEVFDVCLDGGLEQIFIPQTLRNDNFINNIVEISIPW